MDDQQIILTAADQRRRNVGKKRQIKMDTWKDRQRKALKDAGKPYVNRKGEEKRGKSPPKKGLMCRNACVCTKDCRQLTERRKLQLFQEFYGGDYPKQQAIILSGLEQHKVKRRRVEAALPKRVYTYKYHLQQGGQRLEVCKCTFMSVYKLTNSRLQGRTHTWCPQTPDKMDVPESIISDQQEITGSDLMDSSSPTEEESSVCEMLVVTEEEPSDAADPDYASDEEHTERSSNRETSSPAQSSHDRFDADGRSTVGKNGKTSSLHQLENSTDTRPSPTIKASSKTPDGKRVWDKKHYCVFCQQPNAKIARHLERKHANESDVARALSYTKGSKQRRILLEELRNKGDYQHNVKVLEQRKGELVPWRQPPGKAAVENYLPCEHCLAFFVKSELWKHQMTCKSFKDKIKVNKTRRRVQSNASHFIPVSSSSQGCRNIIHSMQQNAVTFHIRNDELICELGHALYGKYGHEKSQHRHIRQKLRELGKLMVEIKKMDKSVQYLKDICKPQKFELVFNGAKVAAGFCPVQNEIKKPSTAISIGYSLKRAAEVLAAQSLINGDEDTEKETKNFLQLMESSWNTCVSCNAHKAVEQHKWNMDDAIPLTEDVMILKEHLQKTEDDARRELEASVSPAAYKKLNKSLLTQVILFNRWRQGDASQLLLQTYLTRNSTALNKDVYDSLSPLEQKLIERLTRKEIQGKCGGEVPVLLTDKMKSSLDFLIEHRDKVGVPAENPYVFARLGACSSIRGCVCLRKYAFECKAKDAKCLISTKLRKHVATLWQLLSLEPHELEQVAEFLGQNTRVQVRCDHYGLPNTLLFAKMSELLCAMESGIGAFKGKNLDSVHLSTDDEDDDPAPSVVPIGSQDRRAVSRPLRKRNHTTKNGTSVPGASGHPVTQRETNQSVMLDHSAVSGTERRRTRPVMTRTAKSRASHDPAYQRDSDQCDEDDDPASPSTSTESQGHSSASSPECKRSRASCDTVSQRKNDQHAPRSKKPWSEDERAAVSKHLAGFMASRRVPGKKDCDSCLRAEPVLQSRTWEDIKNYMRNTIESLKRKRKGKRKRK